MAGSSPIETPGKIPKLTRFAAWMAGGRQRDDRTRGLVLNAYAMESRSLARVFLPMGSIAFLISCLLGFKVLGMDRQTAFVGMAARVFLFDYAIFFLAMLSAWNLCRRWRASPETVEELAVAPVDAREAALSLIGGPMGVWARYIILFALVDFFVPLIVFDAWRFAYKPDLLAPESVLMGSAVLFVHALTSLTFAWFHFESVRIAHWAFVQFAIPRRSLMRAGLSGGFVIALVVFILSIIGSYITLIFVIVGLMVFEPALGYRPETASLYALGQSFVGMEVIVLPGLWAVGLLKVLFARIFEKNFRRVWLCFLWWGAGESPHPAEYPQGFQVIMRVWRAYFDVERAKGKPGSASQTRAAGRYDEYLELIGEANQPLRMQLPPGAVDRLGQLGYRMEKDGSVVKESSEVSGRKSSDSPFPEQDRHTGL